LNPPTIVRYTLSLHDALPIFMTRWKHRFVIVEASVVLLAIAAVVAGSRAAAPDVGADVDRVFERWTTATPGCAVGAAVDGKSILDRKSTRLNSSHDQISYAVF